MPIRLVFVHGISNFFNGQELETQYLIVRLMHIDSAIVRSVSASELSLVAIFSTIDQTCYNLIQSCRKQPKSF